MSLDGSTVVGIDVGGGKIAAGAVSGEGEIARLRRQPTGADRGPGPIIEDLVDLVRACERDAGGRVERVGVGICGQVRRRDGVVRDAPNLADWKDVPLRERMEEALDIPVAVANDVHVIALGEWKHGEPDRVEDLVVVFVGTGVGGGVVSRGELLLGDQGHAGELGHTTIVVEGRRCSCGNLGCLEAYAGGWAIAERAREAVEDDPDAGKRLAELAKRSGELTSITVAEAFQAGDPLARRIVDETALYLASGLVGAVNAFNPRRLVLGGGVIDGVPFLVDRVADHLRERALQVSTEALEVTPARLGSEAGILGGAVLARHTLEVD